MRLQPPKMKPMINTIASLPAIFCLTSAFSNRPMASYPRPLHPGGFSLPPMVEDLIPIATTTAADKDSQLKEENLQKDLLIVRPPDMESLWEWYAYTKRQTDSDPSWGRIWPTALSLARFTLQSLNSVDKEDAAYDIMDLTSKLEEQEQALVKQAIKALHTTSHIIELGCGLGVAGLTYAISAEAMNIKRTVTFLDREPYALHCVMASAAINKVATAPISNEQVGSSSTQPLITARSSIDDWTSTDKNISYKDLQLDALDCDNKQTLILASDILYEPSSMTSLATKLRNLLHPKDGGYVLITDPEKERTSGCRSALVESVKEMGGQVEILPMPQPKNNGMTTNKSMLVESDVDIDGNLAKTVLIVVYLKGT
jgi:predicted nicotinamide N-methyase